MPKPNNLAVLYSSMGQYEKAELLFIQVKEILKKVLGETHPNYASNLDNMAALYQVMGKYEKAEPLILQNNYIVLQNLLKNFTILSEKEKGDYIANKISMLETNNSFIYNHKKASSSFIRNNFNQQLIFKSLTLTDTRNVLSSIQQNADTVIQKLLKDWLNSKCILAKQYSLSIADRRPDINEVETRTESLEKELSRKSSEFRNQQNAIRISLQDVQKNLQQDEVAIEFVSFQLYNKKWTDSTIYAAYILQKTDSVPRFVPLFEEKQLISILENAKKNTTLNKGKSSTKIAATLYNKSDISPGNGTGLGDSLYKLLWVPIEPYLKRSTKISYSPAGLLFEVAIHALPIGEGKILMDKYEFYQYTSTRQIALRNDSAENTKPHSIVLFGDPVFSMDSIDIVTQRGQESRSITPAYSFFSLPKGNRGDAWERLSGTAKEIEGIGKIFNEDSCVVITFREMNASEKNLKELDGQSPQILHLATHGFFLPSPAEKIAKNERFDQGNIYKRSEDPLLRNGIVLAGANYVWTGKAPIEGAEDGIATAYEISQLNLSNTELVVLSACETALGDVKGSEGVFGLQRGLKMAGVKNIIVSLWEVPDEETVELMTIFYSYWLKGKTLEKSFYHAQSDMRKKYPAVKWAAFVLVE